MEPGPPTCDAPPPATRGARGPAGAGLAPGGHLAAVDVIRLITIGGVILVHSTSFANSTTSVAANGVLAVAHITRSVFLALSAFVLTCSFERRPLARRAFWKRRYPLILAPYAVWSAVYFAADGDVRPDLGSLGHFLLDLLDGGADFHLYFLLLTMQLYLVFPALMATLRRWPGILRPALAGAAAFQLAFAAVIHYGWRPPVLGVWFDHPSSWLPSYTLFVVGGVAAARHLEALAVWTRRHLRLVASLAVASITLALASYLAEIRFLGYAPIFASAVFQPANVIEAVAVTLGQFALGLWVADRASAGRLARLERSSDVSFGVYLSHPLVLAGLLDAASTLGLPRVFGSLPSGAVELLIGLGLVPFIYAVSFLAIDGLRRTRASLAFTGRRGPRSAGATAS
jgi:peptidoglycan/LPS O-acetylase OafA/YrhL